MPKPLYDLVSCMLMAWPGARARLDQHTYTYFEVVAPGTPVRPIFLARWRLYDRMSDFQGVTLPCSHTQIWSAT